MDIALYGEITAGVQKNKSPNELSLRPGQILKGRVIDSKDGRLTIFTQGARLAVDSSHNMEANTDVIIKVSEGKGGNVLLEIVPSEGSVEITEEEIPLDYQGKQNDAKINIEGSKEQFIAKVLVSKNLPPNRGNIEEIKNFLAGVPPQEQSKLVDIISELKAKNIPVSQKTIGIFSRASSNPMDYGNILANLRNDLVDFRTALLSRENGISKAEVVNKLVDSIDNVIVNLNSSDKSIVAKQLTDFITKVGLDYENELAKNLLFDKLNVSAKSITDITKSLKGSILSFLDITKFQDGNAKNDLPFSDTPVNIDYNVGADLVSQDENDSIFKKIANQAADVLSKTRLLKPEQQADILGKEIGKLLGENQVDPAKKLSLESVLQLELKDVFDNTRSLNAEQRGNLVGKTVAKVLSENGVHIRDDGAIKSIENISKEIILNKALSAEEQIGKILDAVDGTLKRNGVDPNLRSIELGDAISNKIKEIFSKVSYLPIDDKAARLGKELGSLIDFVGKENIARIVEDAAKGIFGDKRFAPDTQAESIFAAVNDALKRNGIGIDLSNESLAKGIRSKIKEVLMKTTALPVEQKAKLLGKELAGIVELSTTNLKNDENNTLALNSNDTELAEGKKTIENLDERSLDFVDKEKQDISNGSAVNINNEKLKTIETHLESVLQKIETQQLYSNNQGNIQNPPYYLIYLPVKVGEQVFDGELKVFKDPQKKHKAIDPDNFRIAFFLNTANLGPLQIDLSVAKKRVNCNIGVEAEDAQSFINDNQVELRNGLEALAYRVEQIKCLVSKEALKDSTDSAKVPMQKVGMLDMKI